MLYCLMRLIFCTLILAIFFSGYSTAAHTFSMESCDFVKAGMDDQTIDMANCTDHQKNDDLKKDAPQSSKGKCIDCAHCCSSHQANLSQYPMNFLLQAAVLNPVSVSQHDGDYLFSLLRPPKSFV